MPRKYASPPLLEAVCEFRFKESDVWDWTVPGLIYERISPDFPTKRQENVLEVAVSPGQPAEAVRSGAITKMQFLREDRTALVQVQPNVLAVNHLKPYPDWATFRALVVKQLGIYVQVAKQQELVRIGLRYINRIEVPSVTFDLDDYFVAGPKVPAGIPNTFRSFLMQVDIPHVEDPRMSLRLVLGSVPPGAPGQSAVMLDLDMVTEPEHAPSVELVPQWLDVAHDRLEAAFDQSLTDAAHKKLFQEVND